MDREWLTAALALAQEHVRRGAERIARVEQCLAIAEKRGVDSRSLTRTLTTLECSQGLFVDDRDRFQRELDLITQKSTCP
jgi:hypothetical protein